MGRLIFQGVIFHWQRRVKCRNSDLSWGNLLLPTVTVLKIFLSLTYMKSTSTIDTYVIHPVFLHNINLSLLQALKNTCMQQLIVLWTISLIFAFYELAKKNELPGQLPIG